MVKGCWGHTLTAFSLGLELTEVMEFGGSLEPWTGSYEKEHKIANITLLQFSEVFTKGIAKIALLYCPEHIYE